MHTLGHIYLKRMTCGQFRPIGSTTKEIKISVSERNFTVVIFGNVVDIRYTDSVLNLVLANKRNLNRVTILWNKQKLNRNGYANICLLL